MLKITFITLLVLFAGYSISHGIKQTEINECSMWLEQQNQYTEWFASNWQIAQCQHYGVQLEQRTAQDLDANSVIHRQPYIILEN